MKKYWLPSLLLTLAINAHAATGPQDAYFVAVRYAGDPPFSDINIVTASAASTDTKWRHMSRGQAWLNYTVYGPLQITATSSDGLIAQLDAMDAALVKAGIPVKAGIKRFLMSDPALGYGGGGFTQSLCNDRMQIRGSGADTAAHELLHANCIQHEYNFTSTGTQDTGYLGYPPPYYCEQLGWCGIPLTTAPGNYAIIPWEQDTGTTIRLRVDATQPQWPGAFFTDIYFTSVFHAIQITAKVSSLSARLDVDPFPPESYYLTTGQSATFKKDGKDWTITVTSEDHFTLSDGTTPPDPNPPPQGDPECTQSTTIHTGVDTWTAVNFNYSWHPYKNGVEVMGLGGWLGEPNPYLWTGGILYFDVTPQNQSQSGPVNWHKRVGNEWIFVGAKPNCGAPPPTCVSSPNSPVTGTIVLANGHIVATKNGTISGTDERGCAFTWTP